MLAVKQQLPPIGETLKQLRVEYARRTGISRLSQGKLAAALDVDRNTVTAWEKGANVPLDQRLRIADFFEVAPETLGVEGFEPIPTATDRQPEWAKRLEAKVDALIAYHRSGGNTDHLEEV